MRNTGKKAARAKARCAMGGSSAGGAKGTRRSSKSRPSCRGAREQKARSRSFQPKSSRLSRRRFDVPWFVGRKALEGELQEGIFAETYPIGRAALLSLLKGVQRARFVEATGRLELITRDDALITFYVQQMIAPPAKDDLPYLRKRKK